MIQHIIYLNEIFRQYQYVLLNSAVMFIYYLQLVVVGEVVTLQNGPNYIYDSSLK